MKCRHHSEPRADSRQKHWLSEMQLCYKILYYAPRRYPGDHQTNENSECLSGEDLEENYIPNCIHHNSSSQTNFVEMHKLNVGASECTGLIKIRNPCQNLSTQLHIGNVQH
uniref:Uncharacterized protein n=1 Tax=Populus davidiana TaxID=266767 RepID=A0A6M2EYQ5_9ROSI